MDFDALVNVKRIILKKDIDKVDIMLLTSAINNRNVDINKSIQDNLDAIREQQIDINEFMTYLGEFIGLSQDVLIPPIYSFLLRNKAFWPTLLNTLKKDLLTDETLTNIVGYLFSLLATLQDEEYQECAIYLLDILSVKNINYITGVTDHIFIDFITNNMDCLEFKGKSYDFKLTIKSIIIKMFSLGIVKFSDLMSLKKSESEDITTVITTLINLEEYYHIYAIINEKSVDAASLPIINEILFNQLDKLENENSSSAYVINKCLDKLLDMLQDVPKELKK